MPQQNQTRGGDRRRRQPQHAGDDGRVSDKAKRPLDDARVHYPMPDPVNDPVHSTI